MRELKRFPLRTYIEKRRGTRKEASRISRLKGKSGHPQRRHKSKR